MTCKELAERIEAMQPNALPRDVARLCLLLSNAVEDMDQLQDEGTLASVWRELGIRLQAATDQHEAMTSDLERLANNPPAALTLDQVWTLIRAIRVQGQMLQLYLGRAPSSA